MATIVGVRGVTFKEVELDDFDSRFPPGVLIYSAKEAEYKELVLRRDLMQLYPQLAENLDADGMRNFQKHVFFPKFLQDPSLIDIIFPKTIDEMKADDENEMLKQDKLPNVSETDDHTTHIYTHHMVMPKTWATWVHISWHEEMLSKQKQQEMQQKQQAGQDQKDMGDAGGQNQGKGQDGKDAKKPKIGEKQKNPQNAAVPLQGAIQPKAPVKQ